MTGVLAALTETALTGRRKEHCASRSMLRRIEDQLRLWADSSLSEYQAGRKMNAMAARINAYLAPDVTEDTYCERIQQPTWICHDTRPGPFSVTLRRRKLISIARQLRQWSDESRSGGWSTQQCKPMDELAAQIDKNLEAYATHRPMLLHIAEQLRQWADESMTGGWSTHQTKPMRALAAQIDTESWLKAEANDGGCFHGIGHRCPACKELDEMWKVGGKGKPSGDRPRKPVGQGFEDDGVTPRKEGRCVSCGGAVYAHRGEMPLSCSGCASDF